MLLQQAQIKEVQDSLKELDNHSLLMIANIIINLDPQEMADALQAISALPKEERWQIINFIHEGVSRR